jgi:ATP-binding cassette subfamily C protein LapB
MHASMGFKAGEKVAILGPVGSGKSTLLKLLSALYKSQEGTLLLDGIDVFQIAPEYLREKIGYLPQEVRLFNGTLRENLIIGLASPNDEQILAACAKTGLDRIIKAHPQGLNLRIAEGGLGLSGGQKQLAALTRMLIAQPKILILDEPTASMDGDTEIFIMKNLLTQLLPDTLVIFATHKVGLINLAERLIILGQGKVMLDGPREEVLAKIRKPRVVHSNG